MSALYFTSILDRVPLNKNFLIGRLQSNNLRFYELIFLHSYLLPFNADKTPLNIFNRTYFHEFQCAFELKDIVKIINLPFKESNLYFNLG